jgi:hypothetical protein
MSTSMPAVQEQVQQRTQQHQQEWEDTEDMSRVLGDEKKRGNGQEDK